MQEQAQPVLSAQELLAMRDTAKEIMVCEEVLTYAMRLVTATHPEIDGASEFTKKYIRFGASPRAGQALITGGKVRALMHGRYNVSIEDIAVLAYPVLRHRIKPSFQAVTEKMAVDELIKKLVEETREKKSPFSPFAPHGNDKKKKA